MAEAPKPSLRGLEVVGRDLRLLGRPDADAYLQPVLAAAKQNARERARVDAGHRRGSRVERGEYVLEVRDGDHEPPDVELINDIGTEEITDSIGLDAGAWLTIETAWRETYREEYLQCIADDVEETDADGTSWLPRRALANGQCAHCDDPYDAGQRVFVNEDGAVIHGGCWELHEGYTAAMARD